MVMYNYNYIFSKTQPASAAASALFGIGMHRYETGKYGAAGAALKELMERYPDTGKTSKARDILRDLEKNPIR